MFHTYCSMKLFFYKYNNIIIHKFGKFSLFESHKSYAYCKHTLIVQEVTGVSPIICFNLSKAVVIDRVVLI